MPDIRPECYMHYLHDAFPEHLRINAQPVSSVVHNSLNDISLFEHDMWVRDPRLHSPPRNGTIFTKSLTFFKCQAHKQLPTFHNSPINIREKLIFQGIMINRGEKNEQVRGLDNIFNLLCYSPPQTQ